LIGQEGVGSEEYQAFCKNAEQCNREVAMSGEESMVNKTVSLELPLPYDEQGDHDSSTKERSENAA
jgi:hypothetical protein